HPFRVEIGKGAAIALTPLQGGGPAQAGLSGLQHQELEQGPVVTDGHAPLGVVVGEQKRGGGPAAPVPGHREHAPFIAWVTGTRIDSKWLPGRPPEGGSRPFYGVAGDIRRSAANSCSLPENPCSLSVHGD